MRNDECQIDPVALKTFVQALLEQHLRTSHAIMIALSEGFVATMLVLTERAGIDLTWPADNPATYDNKNIQVPSSASDTTSARARPGRLRDKSRELSRFMAR